MDLPLLTELLFLSVIAISGYEIIKNGILALVKGLILL